MTKEVIRVLVMREHAGDKVYAWVAQGLEQDIATQGSLDAGWLEVVTSLGFMFDARDAIVADHAEKNEEVQPCPPAPDEYFGMWERGTDFGKFDLGSKRIAEVRIHRGHV